jgi:hypothetical protein
MDTRARTPRGLEVTFSSVPDPVARYEATPRFSKYSGMPSRHLVLAQSHARSGSVGGNEKRAISGQEYSCRSPEDNSRHWKQDSNGMRLDLLFPRC